MSYRRGAAVLSSDSASTLAIVKELISKEATARRVNITDSFQVRSSAGYKYVHMSKGSNTSWVQTTTEIAHLLKPVSGGVPSPLTRILRERETNHDFSLTILALDTRGTSLAWDSEKGEPNSVPAFLKMLDPKLTNQFALARQVPHR